MTEKMKNELGNSLAEGESRILLPACHLVSLDINLDAPDFPLPPLCQCDFHLPLPCYSEKTCTADCSCDFHICTCDPVCPCLVKCHHCYCDHKFGKSPIDSSILTGCEVHARTLFRVAE